MTANGTVLVRYAYDAWGNIISTTGTMANTLGKDNPFRSRGYYYDTETGFYYLNSRYYNPAVGRFISPEPNVYEGGFDRGAGMLAYNVYAYCSNNPISFLDYNGEFLNCLESNWGYIMSYVKEVIDDWDPIGLLSHAPNDEYQIEIAEIQQLLKITDDAEELSEGIFCIFDRAFGKDVFLKSREECERIAGILISQKRITDIIDS